MIESHLSCFEANARAAVVTELLIAGATMCPIKRVTSRCGIQRAERAARRKQLSGDS
jgi:hypothetical protein